MVMMLGGIVFAILNMIAYSDEDHCKLKDSWPSDYGTWDARTRTYVNLTRGEPTPEMNAFMSAHIGANVMLLIYAVFPFR